MIGLSPDLGMTVLGVIATALAIVAVVLGLTVRRLGGSERRFRGLVESAPDGMMLVDAAGAIVFVNPRAEELFGYRRAELIGQRVEILVPAAARDRHPALRAGYVAASRVRPMGAGLSLLGRRKDGNEIPVEISLSPFATGDGGLFCAVVRDVTERRRAEVEIREARALAEGIVETMNEPLAVLNAELCVEAVNGAFHRTFDVDPGQIRGRSLFALGASVWSSPTLRSRLADVAATGQELKQIEIETDDSEGTRTWRVSARPINRSGAASSQILLVMEDVTERTRAARYLLEREALKRTNRELQDFAYVASHDLQEPLRKIQAFGDRLATTYGPSLPSEAADFVSRMQNAAARMARLIEDLLAFSRVTTRAQTFTRVDLAAIARDVVNDLEIRIEQTGGCVEVGELPVIEGDASQMRQLVQNLVANGLKFHRPDVAPHVQVRVSTPPATSSRSSLCRIEVADNGIGFEEKYLDRIFTIFQRLHGRTAFEGTGLGLAICRKIVERHQGEITATSVPGSGSVFIVTLPTRQRDGLAKEIA